MHALAAPLVAFALAAAMPAVARAQAAPLPAFGGAGAATATSCFRPKYDGVQGATIVFDGPGPGQTNGVVVAPPGTVKNAPAVLWVHWLGEVATTNHTEFLSDARELAKHGVVSLLVDMPWSKKDWFTAGRTPENDYDDTVRQVVTLRHALDCLTKLPGVDATRIAYVGHDFGAMDGALVLAVDDRAAYAVLMAPTLSFWEWYLLGKQPDDRGAYVARMSAFDLPGWLAKGKQKATLLQFGQHDEYVAQATGIALRNAVPNRDRTLKAYKLDHALDDATARDDRRDWLLQHFGL